ncbi:MAG: hexokinase [Dysgonamonadaceae bacterium]|jgi:hexokinase|nr:hexokinase [Dysgonamonadaceae bacterium]
MGNIFSLTNEELQFIASSLKERIEEGLKRDNREILAIPTHIHPKEDMNEERVLALDWGGTNFRAAIVEYKNGKANIIEDCKNRLSAVETKGFNQERLHKKMAEFISGLKQLDERVTKIGYCFSYPAASRLNGDAVLLRWTKGIDIPDMIEKPVGESLLKYLNNHKEIHTTFQDIKVVNDTVACLFSGLTELTEENKPFDSYIGLIVGTGTNMAGLMPLDKIEKLNSKERELIPVNLESGNFNPPHLTVIDSLVDAMSNNKGSQRFEKAISGGYLGEIFKTCFMFEKIKYNFDGADLSEIINHPENSKKEQAEVANRIFARSAQLVAASLAGLVQVLVNQNKETKKIYLAADGTVFRSNDYEKQVEAELKNLLPSGVKMKISEKEKMIEPNLIGSAIAALS